MTDAVELKKGKDRSPTFPFISLERALERVRQFYAEEKRGVAPYSRAVLHWKYTEASSGGQQTVGALKNYGLMSEPAVQNAKGRHLQLTELALRIILDVRPESAERAAYLREAATKPAVASEIYEKWPESLPSDATINHFLVLDKKFTIETATRATKILKENHELASFRGRELESGLTDSDQVNDAEQQVQIQSPEQLKTASKLPLPPAGKATPFTEQLLSLDGKITTTLHFSDTPDANVYRWIATYANLKAENLGKAETARAASGDAATPQ